MRSEACTYLRLCPSVEMNDSLGATCNHQTQADRLLSEAAVTSLASGVFISPACY